jgi:hypothetical protein
MNETTDSTWKDLYRIGGAAPLVALVFYLSEMAIFIFGEPYPTTMEGWFLLFQRSKILGLHYLNVLDMASIALLATLYLALYVALRRVHESHMAVATLFAFIGTVVFIVPRAATLSVLSLSDQYAAAASDAQRSQIIAVAQAITAPAQAATPQTTGFLFIAVAVLIISAVMLRTTLFNRVTAYAGILTGVMTFADQLCMVIAPSIAGLLLPISGLLWIAWWLLVGLRLLGLGRRASMV